MFTEYSLSVRKQATIISTFPSKTFTSRSTRLWNIIAPKLKLLDYSAKTGITKSTLKKCLFELQHNQNKLTWTVEDYNVAKIMHLKVKL